MMLLLISSSMVLSCNLNVGENQGHKRLSLLPYSFRCQLGPFCQTSLELTPSFHSFLSEFLSEWQTGWFRDFAVVYLFRVVSTTCSEILQSSLVKKERYGAQN